MYQGGGVEVVSYWVTLSVLALALGRWAGQVPGGKALQREPTRVGGKVRELGNLVLWE
jgi:hypothetical protein